MVRRRARGPATRRPAHVGRPPAAERDLRRAERREALLDAAVAAVVRHGDEVTMTAMAAEAGVTKPVLYRYFGDRTGLHEALAVRFATGLLDDLRPALDGGGGRDAVARAIDAYLGYVEANRALHRFLVHRLPAADPGGQRLVRGFLHLVAAEVAAAMRPPLVAAGVPEASVELLAFGVTGLVQLGGERWLDQPSVSRPVAVAHLADLAWGGLQAVAGAASEPRTHAATGARR